MEITPHVKTTRTMHRLRSSLYFAFSSLLLITFAPRAHAQDWVRTGSNLGVEKIRMASADFKSASADPQTPVLKATFDNTLYNDLANAGIFDMVPKSMAPAATPAPTTAICNLRLTDHPPDDARHGSARQSAYSRVSHLAPAWRQRPRAGGLSRRR